MAKILAVGVATLDIVNEVAAYPHENAEVRALAHRVRRGGNATNTLVVLSQLGHECAWAGVLADAPDAAVVVDDLGRHGIRTDYCRCLSGVKLPTSSITISRETGSRTIVHYRDLPEYQVEDFFRIPLGEFDWLHFEGRDPGQTLQMMQHAQAQCPELPVSLEVEKSRDGIEALFPYAAVLLFSSEFARQRACPPGALLTEVWRTAPRTRLVCALGEQGAIGIDGSNGVLGVDACPPSDVVDTLGAGDTFNAGVIDALQRGAGLRDAMQFACALAGAKCGRAGLDDLSIPSRIWMNHGRTRV